MDPVFFATFAVFKIGLLSKRTRFHLYVHRQIEYFKVLRRTNRYGRFSFVSLHFSCSSEAIVFSVTTRAYTARACPTFLAIH